MFRGSGLGQDMIFLPLFQCGCGRDGLEPEAVISCFQDVASVNGGVKSDHWAAQKSATLDLGVTRATMRRLGGQVMA